jgi:SAM-dependent methyltransferase
VNLFLRYARYYDSIYADKAYEGECDVIETVVARILGRGPWRILDAGCGTGAHAIALARRGHAVTAVDRSEAMLYVARAKAAGGVTFVAGDLRVLDLGETVDVATCLFAVLSYQLSAAGALAALRSLRAHVRPGGVLVCDFWHAPAVLTVGPTVREKVAWAGRRRVVRTATPLGIDPRAQTNATRYTVRVFDGDDQVDEFEEVHTVRFFYPGEVEGYARAAGFEVLQTFADWDPAAALHDRAWTAVLVARAV